MSKDDDTKSLIELMGKAIEEYYRLPDGSGVMSGSYPLSEDHWMYSKSENPPMPFRMGTNHPKHNEVAEKIREAAKYAVRSATMSGMDMDFDPDALCQNMIVGMLGHWTPDGTSGDDEYRHPCEPSPLPELFPWPK